MKNLSFYAMLTVGILTVYVASYFALRAGGMDFRARRSDGVIKTWVSFGSGHTIASRITSGFYYPMHSLEHRWLLIIHSPVLVYG